MDRVLNFSGITIWQIGRYISIDGKFKLAINCGNQEFAKYWEKIYILTEILNHSKQETQCQN